jgi:integrase/recombinase XerD
MLYATGIRRMEIINLEIKDIDSQECTIFIRHGKGGRDRIVPIAESSLAWVEKYLELVRPLLSQDKEQKTLFLSNSGRPIDHDAFVKRLKRYAKSAGVTKPVSFHKFRHAMATTLLDNGADIRSVQEILGHQSLASTQVYTKVAIRKLKEVHERTHPARSKPSPNRNENI